MDYNSLYLYGVFEGRANKPFKSKGIGDRGDEIYTVHQRDLGIIVSKTPFEEYDPTDENSLAHETVLQEALLEHGLNIAPMRFCTVVRKTGDASQILNKGYTIFKTNLMRTRQKKEMNVKVFLDVASLQKTLKEGEDIVEKSRDIATQFHSRLKKKVVDSLLNELVTEDMIMNAAFLVKDHDIELFKKEILDFDQIHGEHVRIRLAGPHAPYHFVRMPDQKGKF